VAALCDLLESGVAPQDARTLQLAWKHYEETVRRFALIEDTETRDRVFFDELRPASDEVRSGLTTAVAASLAYVDLQAKKEHGRVARVKTVLLSITALGIIMCVGFIAALGNLLRKPAHELVRMIDGITASDELRTPKAKSAEVGAVVNALDRLLVNIRETRRSDLLMISQIERRAEYAMDCIPDALALADKSGRVFYSNKRLVELLQKSPASIKDIPWTRVVRLIEACMTTGTPQVLVDMEKAIQHFHDGVEKFYLPGVFPLKTDEGVVHEVVILMSDVSYIKQLDEMKVDLVATVSHQLKTPLTSIRMSLHMLKANRSDSLSPQNCELIETALEESERLHDAIKSLMELARLQSGAVDMTFEPVETSTWIQMTAEEHRGALDACGITLTVEVEPDLPTLYLDKTHMATVLEKLITNTSKHCREGDKVTVSATSEHRGDLAHVVTILVVDTGPGIEAAAIARVFERFYRTASQKNPGAGLGLAIAQKIVQAHGGEMTCSSIVGEGSTFVITLYSGSA
jgi:signal transduction histidine kinase